MQHTATEWIGKWVVVTPVIPIGGLVTSMTGRLREVWPDGVLLELLGVQTAIAFRHIVAIQYPINQDAITIEAMNMADRSAQ